MKVKRCIVTICIMFLFLPAYLAGQGVILSSGIYLKMSGGTMVLHGNWVNNGNYADTNSTILLNDTTQQHIGGSSYTEFDDLTINNPKGVIGSHDFSVEGVLNLQSTNASDTVGTLDMGSNTLTMDSSATTIGAGDVTGIVRRIVFTINTPYTFGNQFTTLTIASGGTLPTSVSFKIIITAANLSWKPNAIHRYFDIARTGGSSSTKVTLNLHYLENELNGTTENNMDLFDYHVSGNLDVDDHGHSNNSATSNWVGLSNLSLTYIAPQSGFPSKYWSLGTSVFADYTWLGAMDSDWNKTDNWVGAIPASGNHVVIPDAAITNFDPVLPSSTTIGSIIIQGSGILNGGNGTTLTIDGGSSAWDNNGTFNAGTSTIVFTNAAATMSDPTNFYNVTVADGAQLSLATNNIMRIAGTLSLSSTGVLNAASNHNTIEYNGDNQTVVNPNGTTPGYHDLILSGSGTKTMPGTAMAVQGDFYMSGTATAAVGAALAITGNVTIGSDATFNTGAYNHTIGGNFTNNGALTAAGSTITCNGIQAQTIGGTAANTFDNFTSNNAADVTLASDALTTVSGTLTINSGKQLSIAPGKQLTAEGTITNNAGASNFVLQSGAAGTASLLHNSGNVPATVQRYISDDAEAWHFISSPVAAQGISGSWRPAGTYGNGTGYDLYVWNEPSSCWIYSLNTTSAINWNTVHPGSNFTPGRGYLYSVQAANPTKAFAGNLNNGSVIYPLTDSSSNVSVKGFNLVGNPYPSAVDWQAASGWTRSNLVSSGGGYDMWIWNPAANNYGVCNSATGICTNSVTRYIPSTQGFFVQAAADGDLGMNNTLRLHNSGAWFKNGEMNPGFFSVIVESEADKSFDESGLLFGYYTNEPGARKLFSNVITAPSLYMPDGNDFYSVRYFTDTVDNPKVPVMFKPGKDGDYTLKCNFDADKFEYVKLEDRQTGYLQDLNAVSTYRFNASKTDDANRFVLHFSPDDILYGYRLPARIYADGSRLIIDLTKVRKSTEVYVYDALGRLILQRTLEGSTLQKLSINAKTQLLIVKLKNQQGSLCTKLIYDCNY